MAFFNLVLSLMLIIKHLLFIFSTYVQLIVVSTVLSHIIETFAKMGNCLPRQSSVLFSDSVITVKLIISWNPLDHVNFHCVPKCKALMY